MPRTARKKSSTKIYHVILRGINRQTIFDDKEDNEAFLQTLFDCKKLCGFELYGYCLMGNHVHLLLKEGLEELERVFKRIGARYVYWYNWKYKRCGHLFQDRYKSEPVEDDSYFVTVLRYIHQNPIKAGICKELDEYEWSSYNDYLDKRKTIDFEFGLEIIGEEEFVKVMKQNSDDKCLENEEKSKRLTDEELIVMIEKRFRMKAKMVQNEPRTTMEYLLKEILEIEGVSTRQLSRVTGVSNNVIWRL